MELIFVYTNVNIVSRVVNLNSLNQNWTPLDDFHRFWINKCKFRLAVMLHCQL